MSNYDFIPENDESCTEEQFEMLLKTIAANFNTNIYDGKNRYAPKVGVCFKDGRYYFGDMKDNGFVFYPSTSDIERALAVFKEKGYYPYYDFDVCYYGVVKDKADVKGAHAIAHTRWL